MTALVPFPKWVLCQFLVNRCLCCKKHCHSWLQWAGQKPKTWRLRNLSGNLPGKEKKLHCSNPVQKDWVCLAQLLAPAVRAVSSFQLDVWARTALEQGSTTCLRFLLSIPDAGLLQSASQGGHMAKAATILSWAAPRSHKSKSAFVCQTRHLKYHPKRSQKRFDLSFQVWTRRCCQHRLFSLISMIDTPARSTILAVLVRICHHHLLFVGMSMCYKITRLNGEKEASSTF